VNSFLTPVFLQWFLIFLNLVYLVQSHYLTVMLNILKPFWKNNKEDIIQGVTSGLKNIASTYVKSPPFSTYKEEIINPILNKIKEKSMNEHLRGDGLKKNKRLTKKSKEIIKNLLKAEVS
jgi:hypothetical protein